MNYMHKQFLFITIRPGKIRPYLMITILSRQETPFVDNNLKSFSSP